MTRHKYFLEKNYRKGLTVVHLRVSNKRLWPVFYQEEYGVKALVDGWEEILQGKLHLSRVDINSAMDSSSLSCCIGNITLVYDYLSFELFVCLLVLRLEYDTCFVSGVELIL